MRCCPSRTRTGDSESDYLCDGLTDSLIATLSGLPNLKVISRRSSFTFKDSSDDSQAIGRKLGVEALVMGRVTRRGEQLAVSAELVDVADNRQLWGERIEHGTGDVLAIERDLSSALTRTLRVELTDEAANQLARRYDVNPEAHQLYLQGRQLMIGSSREMNKAEEYFRKAIDLDPDFALAYANLGYAYVIQAYHSTMGRDEALDKARDAVRKALEIDDQLAEAHAVSAEIKYMFDWDWEGADRDLKRAIELNPGSDTARLVYADFLASMGRFDEAIAQSEKAKELDPLSPAAAHMLAFALMGTRDYDRAAAGVSRRPRPQPQLDLGLHQARQDARRHRPVRGSTHHRRGGRSAAARRQHSACALVAGLHLRHLRRARTSPRRTQRNSTRWPRRATWIRDVTRSCTSQSAPWIRCSTRSSRSVADHSPDAIYMPVMPDYFLPGDRRRTPLSGSTEGDENPRAKPATGRRLT